MIQPDRALAKQAVGLGFCFGTVIETSPPARTEVALDRGLATSAPCTCDVGVPELPSRDRPPAGRGASQEPDLALDDIRMLLHALTSRLATTVGDAFARHCESLDQDPWSQISASVLECVAEMDHLHQTMGSIVDQRQSLEQTITELRSALVSAQTELLGTKAGEREARRVAAYDDLTLLPNASQFRALLDRVLTQADAGSRHVAVLRLDLDDFKAIVDTHGRDIGDALLRILAERLTAGIRAEDLVSRVGGDEFACLLFGVSDRAQLSGLVSKLFDAVSGPVKLGALSLCVRPSIGVAMFPADGTTASALIEHADAAMHRAKRQRCGHAFLDQGVDAWPQHSTVGSTLDSLSEGP